MEEEKQNQSRLQDLAVSERGFVFDPFTGYTYSTNPCGLSILNGLKQGYDVAQLVEDLQQEFEVPDDADLARDVIEFVGQLRANGLMSGEVEP